MGVKKRTIFIMFLFASITGLILAGAVDAQSQFKVNNTLNGFQASALLCSFNATAGSIVELNLTIKGNNAFETTLEIAGKTQGNVFNSTAYGNFVGKYQQTVKLSFADSYNVTLSKHPFYTDLNAIGTINLREDNANHNSSPSPSIPEFQSLPLLGLVFVTFLVGVFIDRKISPRTVTRLGR